MLAALATMQREFLLAPTVMRWVDNDLVASTACIILAAALVVAGRLTHPARHDLVAARWTPSMATKGAQ